VTRSRPLLEAAERVRMDDPDCREIVDAVRTLALVAFAGAISRVPELAKNLCLKGGTLLRILNKGRIGRLPSMDLDATVLGQPFDPEIVETRVMSELRTLLVELYRDELTIRVERRPQNPHRRPQDSIIHVYRIHAQAAINRAAPARRSSIEPNEFKFEATEQEMVDQGLLLQLDQEMYGIHIAMPAYAPLQSIAEKLRALLQKLSHYEDGLARGIPADSPGLRGNFIPRHVLDLEILLQLTQPGEIADLARLFHAKCEVKNIPASERTLDRLMHPMMRQRIEEQHPERAASAWRTLGELARLVVKDDQK
jgi:hypothetical protein